MMENSRPISSGMCNDRFRLVQEEFQRNFAERGELGAAVAIYLDGKLVVDLWQGIADRETGRMWDRDTMAVVFSSTKGIAATCLHVLIDRGLVDVDAPVTRYWPEFAANGKAGVTVGMIMSHQAGLPLWQTAVPKGGLFDWEFATSSLALEAPIWEPGTCHGYHAMTLGYLEGEIVRRVVGQSIGAFLRHEIAGPLGADIWIGLPESEEARVSTLQLADGAPVSAFHSKMIAEPNWIGVKVLSNVGEAFTESSVNSRAYHAAEAPASGGIANARGLARLYSPLSLDGSVDGVRIVSPRSIPLMRNIKSASSCDLMLRLPTNFTLGYSKSWGARALGAGNYVVLGEHAFGTPGMGGSIGFADTEARMSFGYTMNRLGGGVGLNERGQSLVDAAYRSLGYTSSHPGFWVQ
jgi:CubicO group peptidase (beta-lactamase class C family)